ncbi:hypothetical protein LIER_29750 [Lithospermum erythrorhizon]|uniref:Uncharacterized protein n=1 Tax=Lithospermum erythrorhizon TaxID=34254 RepID=A0AAV3RP81_LITER
MIAGRGPNSTTLCISSLSRKGRRDRRHPGPRLLPEPGWRRGQQSYKRNVGSIEGGEKKESFLGQCKEGKLIVEHKGQASAEFIKGDLPFRIQNTSGNEEREISSKVATNDGLGGNGCNVQRR